MYTKSTKLCIVASLAFFGSTTFHVQAFTPYQAITIVPVADLVGQPFAQLNAKNNPITSYAKMPFDAKLGSFACPRLHQLIFNEQVTVIDERDDEACVLVPNVFFITQASNEKQQLYWTLKKNLMPLAQLRNKKINTAHLPQPVVYEKNKTVHHPNTITLAYPYTCKALNMTFSAGTRFVKAPQLKDEHVSVHALDPQKQTMRQLLLPKKLCVEHKQRTNEEQITLYVKILKLWTQQQNGFIPYVWGGCSFGPTCSQDTFVTKAAKTHKEDTYWFERPGSNGPCWGLDCTGLVARSAQIAGIPYYFKNTTTLKQFLEPITERSKVHVGDLIWFPGHVMVVGDLQKNTIIEARAYKYGYGKVHEIALAEVFEGITTFDKLVKALNNKETLKRLNRDGSFAHNVKDYKLLAMSSAWNFEHKKSPR